MVLPLTDIPSFVQTVLWLACELFFSLCYYRKVSKENSCQQFAQILIYLEGELEEVKDGIPLQHSCLENPMDGRAWWAAVHGVAKSRTWRSDFTFTFHFYALEKEMATHSSVLAWRIPGTGEPCGLPSMGSHRVGHDWSDLAAAAKGINLRLQISHWNCPPRKFIQITVH